jgi:hypothetical protein
MNFIPKIEYVQRVTGLTKTVTFDSPPEGDPFGESYRDSKVVTRSNDGTPQTQFNHTIKTISVEFIFQSEAVKNDVLEFRETAKYGGTFKYFPSSDEVDFEEYKLDGRQIDLGRPIPAATPGEFEYDFKLDLSRVS